MPPTSKTTRSIALAVSSGPLALLLLALAHGGCTSSSTTVTLACASTPVPPAQDPFCTALADYDGRCGHCQDCTEQNLQNCTKLGATVSDAYRGAFVSCKDAAACDGDPRFSTCVEQQMANAVPTAAQAQAKDAYCAACNATNASDCAAFFTVDPAGGKNGAGYNVLLYGDQVATMAVTTCSTKCDPFQYGVCTALLSCGPSGGDHCADGGWCAAH